MKFQGRECIPYELHPLAPPNNAASLSIHTIREEIEIKYRGYRLDEGILDKIKLTIMDHLRKVQEKHPDVQCCFFGPEHKNEMDDYDFYRTIHFPSSRVPKDKCLITGWPPKVIVNASIDGHLEICFDIPDNEYGEYEEQNETS